VREKLLPCSVLQRLVGPSVYTRSAQNSVMPAQYYKDPRKIPQYLASNDFLVDINNERAEKNAEYKRNFMKLNKLVIYHFDEEEIVYPQESTNFGYFENGKIVSMRELPIYKEDWIGLKELDKRKAIIQIKLPGEHVRTIYKLQCLIFIAEY
jgi:palmitoyl-protein thioesterase